MEKPSSHYHYPLIMKPQATDQYMQDEPCQSGGDERRRFDEEARLYQKEKRIRLLSGSLFIMVSYYNSINHDHFQIRRFGIKLLALFLVIGLGPLALFYGLHFLCALVQSSSEGAAMAAPSWRICGLTVAITTLFCFLTAMLARDRISQPVEHLMQALDESEQRLRAVGNNIPGSAIFQLSRASDGAQKFVYMSAGITDILGLPAEAFLRWAGALYDSAIDDDRDRLIELTSQSARDMTVLNFEGRFNGSRSAIKWLRLCSVPRRQDDGLIIWDGLIIDITERTLAEKALRASEQRYRDLIETIPHGIQEIDLEGRIIFCNPAHNRIFGYEANEALGKCVFDDLIDEADRELTRRMLPTLIHDQPQIETMISQHITKDGRRIWAQIDWNYKRNDAGKVVGFISVITDTTKRKDAEIALISQARELARSNEDLRQFAYVASHDLQEPLRSIAGYVQIIEKRYRDQLDETASRFIDKSVDATKRMQIMINSLMEYSRVSARSKPFEDFDCEVMTRNVLDNLSLLIENSHAEIVCGAMPVIRGDATQLSRVLQNLISNSIKFHNGSPPRIEIEVTAVDKNREDVPEAARRPGWLFTVRDNGIGIDPEDFNKIFMIFQRLHSQKDYPGAGIGLAICKKIVERHGGHIWVESQPAQGATFNFTVCEKNEDHG